MGGKLRRRGETDGSSRSGTLEGNRSAKWVGSEASRSAEGRGDLLERLLRSMERKLDGEDFKASVGDYIRLLQLRKEIEEERPREITVRWVEPSEEEDVPAR